MSPKAAVAVAKSVKKDNEKTRKRLLQKREELLQDLVKNREVSEETIDESAQDMLFEHGQTAARKFLSTWDFDAYVAKFRSGDTIDLTADHATTAPQPSGAADDGHATPS
jgi:hypothetical protein